MRSLNFLPTHPLRPATARPVLRTLHARVTKNRRAFLRQQSLIALTEQDDRFELLLTCLTITATALAQHIHANGAPTREELLGVVELGEVFQQNVPANLVGPAITAAIRLGAGLPGDAEELLAYPNVWASTWSTLLAFTFGLLQVQASQRQESVLHAYERLERDVLALRIETEPRRAG